MNKIISSIFVCIGALVCMYLVFNFFSFGSEAAIDTVDLSIDVQTYLNFSLDVPGKDIVFGSFNPGTEICSSTATVASVNTNAENGYTIGVSDTSDTNSALAKGGSIFIPDYAGTLTTPTEWTGTGLGISMWDADTNHETKWCKGGTVADCTTVCDADNLYAGIPAAATTAHTVTGKRDTTDTSSWSWKIDAPNTQETGAYTGTVTFTATGVLS